MSAKRALLRRSSGVGRSSRSRRPRLAVRARSRSSPRAAGSPSSRGGTRAASPSPRSAGAASPALRGKEVAFIGAGNMGQALLRGLLAAGCRASDLSIVEARPDTRQLVRRRYRVASVELADAAGRADVLVIAVKPQDVRPMLDELRPLVAKRTTAPLVLSIAAGLPIAFFERSLSRCPVIRIMPNLPATVGQGVSAVAAGRRATAAHRRLARAIFASVGEVVELPERLFDAVTAVSGSGPAYYFLVFKALEDAAMAQGVPADVARRLVLQTARGSALLVEGSADDLATLIGRVASKGGTTEAALRRFAELGVADGLQRGVEAAAARSRELSAAYGTATGGR